MWRYLLLGLWSNSCVAFGGENFHRALEVTHHEWHDHKGSSFRPKSDVNSSFSLPANLQSTDFLSGRQEWVCDVGKYMCPNGKCCDIGYNCVTVGCCEGEKEACGTNGCYDPLTKVCCGDSGTCDIGYVCLEHGCCLAGHLECGSGGCYDPETEVCCVVDGTTCDKGEDCMANGGCCPSGELSCGEDKCYDPDTQVCCTDDMGNAWGCKAGSECCVSAQACYVPETETCCTNGVCLKEHSCCEKECCSPEAKCGGDGRCTMTSSTAATRSTTRIRTATTMRTRSSSSCVTPTLTTPQTKTQTISFGYDPSRRVVATDGPYAGQTISGSNKAVMMNMCDGIKAINPAGGETLELTHGGKCFQKQNRRKMCEQKGQRCKDAINEYIQEVYPTGVPPWAKAAITAAGDLTCDEFPFASSLEGGDLSNGVTKCVPSAQQNWQGGTMSSFFNPKNSKYIAPGEKYHIQLVGWDCSKQVPTKRSLAAPLEPRDAFTNAAGVRMTGVEMFHHFDPESPALKMMSLPLGDLEAGSYVVHLDIRGNLNISLTDFNGQQYDFTQNPDRSITFLLDDDYDGIGLYGITTDPDDEVDVIYRASKISSGNVETTTAVTQPEAPTPTKSTNSNGGVDVVGVSPTTAAVIGFLFLIANFN